MSQTLDPILVCLEPDLGSPRGRTFGPFAGIRTVGIYHDPQPKLGFRAVLQSLTMTVKDSLNRYNARFAPAWSAAFIPREIAPASPGDTSAINSAALQQPAQHPFYFRLGAPSVEARALNYLNNDGRGYVPPRDEDGRCWGLLVRGADIPIGGIVVISPNWKIERDPNYLLRVNE